MKNPNEPAITAMRTSARARVLVNETANSITRTSFQRKSNQYQPTAWFTAPACAISAHVKKSTDPMLRGWVRFGRTPEIADRTTNVRPMISDGR